MRIARFIVAVTVVGWIAAASIHVSDPTTKAPVAMSVMMPQMAWAQDAPKVPDVQIDINKGGDRVIWYANPTILLAIAAVGVVLLVAILAGRGGGTTVIKS